MHFKAVEAHLKQNGKLPLNIKMILEGEEEVGSVNLDNFIRDHKSELGADVVVISDSPMFARGVPSICYGLRGLVYFQIDLRGSSTDLHSGSFGGAVVNPAFALSQILDPKPLNQIEVRSMTLSCSPISRSTMCGAST